ncbi:MAG: hypothetical protein EBT45_05045 [Alphaproteobacteria bacterium]|nr:hypothetical protein [Alphaproteobacteria bacterium]
MSKLISLDEQIKTLQEKKRKLEEKSLQDLAKIIKKLGADSLSPEIIIGSLFEAVEAFHQKKDITKKWQAKGKEILEASKKSKGGKTSNSFRDSDQNTETTS